MFETYSDGHFDYGALHGADDLLHRFRHEHDEGDGLYHHWRLVRLYRADAVSHAAVLPAHPRRTGGWKQEKKADKVVQRLHCY